MNGSYPISALFKIISYYIATIAITRGIAATEKPDEYLSFCVMIITPLMLISLPMIPFGKFRLINGSFQGAFNHPNMCGIMCAIYISLLVMYKKYFDRGSTIIVVAVLVMLYLSASRTGMIAAMICLVIGYKYMFNRNTRLFVFAVGGIALLLMWPSVSEQMNAFLFKTGGNTSILYSREGQMMTFLSKFRANPTMGSGFAVPYYPGIKDYSLNMDLQVEPGNLIWAVLGDCGIIGFISFILYFLVLTLSKFDYKKILFVAAPLLVSMGEMAFFSVNSIAILYYVMFGLYMFIEEPYEVNMDEPSSY